MAVFSFCSRPPGPCWWHGGSRKAARRLSPPHSSSGSESRKKPLNQRAARRTSGPGTSLARTPGSGRCASNHRVASRVVSNGVPLPAMVRLLDHRQFRTTLHYTHVGDGEENIASERISKVVASITPTTRKRLSDDRSGKSADCWASNFRSEVRDAPNADTSRRVCHGASVAPSRGASAHRIILGDNLPEDERQRIPAPAQDRSGADGRRGLAT